MTWNWTAKELRTAIAQCEAECEQLVLNGASPETLYGRRAGIDALYNLLHDAERNEINAKGAVV